MFQLRTEVSIELLAQHLDFVGLSSRDGLGRAQALSMFSFSSEILEKGVPDSDTEAYEKGAALQA